ncbi:MAG: tetratricopeptide repeat protein [Bacteroidales bacterium]|nr:tetratricopeptide repeat protein [Bacteroidales bacterium]
MKKILTILAVAASLFAVDAQAQNKSLAAAKAALEKAQAAAENPKQNTKMATWLKYGQTLMDAYNAPAGNAWVGMSRQELQVLAGGERPMSESQVEIGGKQLVKQVFANKNYYFNEAGQLAVIEVTQPLVANALDKAVEAYKKAAELDTKGQKTKDISAALENIVEKYTDDAYNAYSLGKMADASQLFEKAYKASCTAPLNQVDTNSLYNAGLTAWEALDWNRAKGFFEEGINKYQYYGTAGESYAKLADIADRLGDKVASKRYLEEGSKKFPESQSLLIGLINYYINSGDDTEQLFSLFKEAQKNEPDNASLFYVEGNARAKLGQNEEALAAYDKAIAINPNYEWGYIGKGIQLYNMAVDLQDKASQEMNDAKYMALMGEFEQALKGCIDPFEKAFNLVNDETKANIAEYLKNACFRFRSEGGEYQEKYEKYSAAAENK